MRRQAERILAALVTGFVAAVVPGAGIVLAAVWLRRYTRLVAARRSRALPTRGENR